MTTQNNNTKSSVPIGVEISRPDDSDRLLGDGRGNRYERIAARFPSSGRYHYGYNGVRWNRLYEMFQDMIDKDPHLASVIETRRKAVTARPWSVEPASPSPRDRRIAEFVKEALLNVRDFELALKHMLGAVGFGWNVSEILWTRRADGRIGIEAIRSRWPGRFFLDAEGVLHLKRSRWELSGDPVPARKFVVTVFGGEHDNAYGVGLCLRAFWYWWFKKNAMRFWNLFNEKYGSPLAVAKHPPGASEEVRNRLREVLEALQTDSGVVLEEGQLIEFIQSAGSAMGRINQFMDLAEFCNAETSKLFIGQTLAVSESRRTGSLAQARVHEQVRHDYIEDDARMLMSVVNRQLVRWLVDLNFGEATPAPRFVIDTEPERDLRELSEAIAGSVRMGLPVPARWIYEQLGIPQPEGDERVLRFDDQNLYQYHLQWGILTINEVRRSLGLPPLPHGDMPANPELVTRLRDLGALPAPTPEDAPTDRSDGPGFNPPRSGSAEEDPDERARDGDRQNEK